MEKEFVPYELAVKLKELGFDKECFGFYYKHGNSQNYKLLMENENQYPISFRMHTLAPLWQQAFDWFREKHNIGYGIHPMDNSMFVTDIKNANLDVYDGFNTYEQARLACLEKLIELVTNK